MSATIEPVTKSDYKTYLKTLNRVTMQVMAGMLAERNELASKYNSLVKTHVEMLKESKKPYDGVSKVDDLSMSQITIGMSKDNVSIPFALFAKDQTANLVGILSKSRKKGGLVSGKSARTAKVVNIHTGDAAGDLFARLRDTLAELGASSAQLKAVDAANREVEATNVFTNAYLSKLLSMISYLAKDSITSGYTDPRGLVILADGLATASGSVKNIHFTKKFVDEVLGSGAFAAYREERIAELEKKIAGTSNAATKSKLKGSLANLKSDDGKRYLAFLQVLQLFQKTARHENYDELSKLSKSTKNQTKRQELKRPLDDVARVATPKQSSFVGIVEDVAKARSPRGAKPSSARVRRS